jgi:hypothetical protein
LAPLSVRDRDCTLAGIAWAQSHFSQEMDARGNAAVELAQAKALVGGVHASL